MFHNNHIEGKLKRIIPNYRQTVVLFAMMIMISLPNASAQTPRVKEKNFAGRGKKLLEQNRFAEAIEVLTASLQQHPNNASVLADRGNAYLSLGKFAEALADFTAIQRITPTNPKPWCYAGVCLRGMQKCNQAIQLFDKALELQPSLVMAYMERGYCYYDIKNYRLAEKDYSAACKLQPKNSDVWYSLSLAQQQLGNTAAALESVSKALKINNANSSYHLHRGYILQELGEKAIASFDARPCDSILFSPSIKSVQTVRNRIGNYSQIIADATAASSEPSNRLHALQLRGYTYLMFGEFKKSVADFSKVISAVPTQSQPYYYRALARGKMREFSKALTDINRAVQLQPRSVDFLLLRGVILTDMGRVQDAIAIFSGIIKSDSSNSLALYNRATSYLAENNNYEAYKDLTQSLALNGSFADGWYQRGATLLRMADSLASVRKPRLDTVSYRSETGVEEHIRSHSDRDTSLIRRAIDDLTTSLRLRCTDADAFAARASCYNILENYTAGLNDARRAIELDGKHISGWIEYGMAYYGTAHIDEMTAAFRNAARIAPNNSTARYNFGFALFNRADSVFHAENGRTPHLDSLAKEAQKEFWAAYKLDTASSDTRVMLGVSYYFLRKYKECLQYCRDESNNPIEMYYRGLALAEYGDIDTAITALREFLSVGYRREYRNNAASVLETLLKQ